MPLRDFQERDVERIREAVMRVGSAVYVLATGGGKMWIAADISRRTIAKGHQVAIMVHRRELVKQSINTLSEACPGMSIGVESAGWPSMPWALLQVGSVASMVRRGPRIKPRVVIWDECHHSRAKTWELVKAMWPDAAHIGMTATPQRLDGKGLGEHFAEMVLGPNIPDLVEQGYLAPCRILTLPSHFQREKMRQDRNGELRRQDVDEQVTDAVIADAVNAYTTYAMGKRAIFFGVHTGHSKRVCEGLRERGVRAEHVEGTDPTARRDRIMNELRTGGLDVVGNCDLISEGFDAPACEVIIMGSPTQSVTRYLQQAGRAMRPGIGKTALILDCAGNAHELGLPDEVREWTLDDGEVNEDKAKKKHPRVCIKCYTAFYGRMCPNCLYSEPLGEVPETITELVEAQWVAKPAPTRRKQLNYELAMAWQADDPKSAVREVGRQHGYKSGWAEHILRIKGWCDELLQ